MLTHDDFNERSRGRLPGLLGVDILEAARGRIVARLPVGESLLAPNGFLHAASVIALADTACGYGALASLPDGATGFTTVELKTNFTGTAREGTIACEATLLHGGRTTQVWDATVRGSDGRAIAAFRCTQLMLYPAE